VAKRAADKRRALVGMEEQALSPPSSWLVTMILLALKRSIRLPPCHFETPDPSGTFDQTYRRYLRCLYRLRICELHNRALLR